MNTSSFILTLVIIILIGTALVGGFLYIRNKVRRFSRAAFGTDDLLKGIEQTNEELASRPKSVSGLTRLMLPKIAKDFPDFSYPEMRERSNLLLTSYLRAIDEKDAALLKNECSELREQFEHQLVRNDSHHETEHFHQIRIHQTEISNYKKSEGRCVITFQSALESFHYFTDSDDTVIRGAKDMKEQSRYETSLVYIQNREFVENEAERSLGMTCPNCGAPLTSLGSKKCEYCGSPVLELNIHAWTFTAVKEN